MTKIMIHIYFHGDFEYFTLQWPKNSVVISISTYEWFEHKVYVCDGAWNARDMQFVFHKGLLLTNFQYYVQYMHSQSLIEIEQPPAIVPAHEQLLQINSS